MSEKQPNVDSSFEADFSVPSCSFVCTSPSSTGGSTTGSTTGSTGTHAVSSASSGSSISISSSSSPSASKHDIGPQLAVLGTSCVDIIDELDRVLKSVAFVFAVLAV